MTIRVCAGGPPEHRALEAWRILTQGAHRFRTIVPQLLMRLQRHRCYLCLEPMDLSVELRSRNPLGWTWEHVFPRAVGGGERSNALLAHRLCNDAKSHRWPYPCEVVYLFAMYAEPYDAPVMRLAKAAQIVARNQRRRYAIEQANA